MIEQHNIYDLHQSRRETRRQLLAEQALRDAWQHLEALEEAETRGEAKAYEHARKLKGGLSAFFVSAAGIAVFLGLCLLWGRR